MALSLNTVWECRSAANTTLYVGPGFNASNPNATKTATNNYTYGPSEGSFQVTDLASSNATSASPQVTSATRPFVAADAGHLIGIYAGTGWGYAFYEIISVTGGVATLDRVCGTTASVNGGTMGLGGWATYPGAVIPQISGMTLYVKAGTYNVSGTSQNASTVGSSNGGPLTLVAGTAASLTTLYGYNTTRGDKPDTGSRPLLNWTGNPGTSQITFNIQANYTQVAYFDINGNNFGNPWGIAGSNGSVIGTNLSQCHHCRAYNLGFGFLWCRPVYCQADNCLNTGFFGCNALLCVARNNLVSGFSNGGTASYCVSIASRQNTSQIGFNLIQSALGCTSVGHGLAGFKNVYETIGCLAYDNVVDVDFISTGYYSSNAYVTTLNSGNAMIEGSVVLTANPFINWSTSTRSANGSIDLNLNTISGGGDSIKNMASVYLPTLNNGLLTLSPGTYPPVSTAGGILNVNFGGGFN